MAHNDSHKHESGFTSVIIQENHSVMLSTLAGCTLGVWISHGEGKFELPLPEENYHITGKYGYEHYPANPNGSHYNTAMMASADGSTPGYHAAHRAFDLSLELGTLSERPDR